MDNNTIGKIIIFVWFSASAFPPFALTSSFGLQAWELVWQPGDELEGRKEGAPIRLKREKLPAKEGRIAVLQHSQ